MNLHELQLFRGWVLNSLIPMTFPYNLTVILSSALMWDDLLNAVNSFYYYWLMKKLILTVAR